MSLGNQKAGREAKRAAYSPLRLAFCPVNKKPLKPVYAGRFSGPYDKGELKKLWWYLEKRLVLLGRHSGRL